MALSHVVAQAASSGPCGPAEDAHWLCTFAYESTGSDVVARIANVAALSLRIVTILLIAFVVSRIAQRLTARFGRRMEQRIEERLRRAERRGSIDQASRYRTRRLQRLQAVVGVFKGLIAAVVWISAIFVILFELDVRLQPILAGAGLIGVIVGFGAQQLVRDVIAGIAMLIEDQYGVGDWIEVDGVFGEVERVGLRSTAFRDMDGVVHHVLNGYIQRVGNLSQHWARATFDVPLSLDADVPAAKAIIHKVAADLARDPVWGADIIGEPEIWGVQEFGPEGVAIRLVVATKPLRNWDIKRQLRERIKFAFDQAHIRMPSQLVEVAGQPTGPPMTLRGTSTDDRHVHVPGTAPLVPPDIGPLDKPPATVGSDDTTGDVALPDRDHTEQLRIDRGPQPRPD